MLRELVTRPVNAAIALIELPATVQRSLRQANELMETSQRQLEAMQNQTDEALRQAERMNDLLGRVVRLTEPLEFAARGSEYVGGRLKRALLGDEVEIPPDRDSRLERAVEVENEELGAGGGTGDREDGSDGGRELPGDLKGR